RFAVYRAASAEERWKAYLALAQATDREADPDRRAWHLAAAAAGPDEQAAFELERSAGRAQARGGVGAAAAFLQRAAALRADQPGRAARALAGARASLVAGALAAAAELVSSAGAVDARRQTQADLLRGDIAFAAGRGGEAPNLLLHAARRLEAL